MELFWFLPTHGDSHFLGTTLGARVVDLSYLQQIARASDSLGFSGVLLPTGRSCEDPWVVAAAMVPCTRRLKFLVALRPGIVAPTAGARMAATLDRLSEGRVLINVVTGGDPAEAEGDGIFLAHDARYRKTDEFLSIWRRVLAGETLNFEGQYLSVKNAKLLFPSLQRPHPPLYFGGSSAAGHELAAKHANVYLTWGEPPAAVAKKVADVKRRAAERGRSVRFGIRLHVIVRRSRVEAWTAAEDLIAHLDDSAVRAAQESFSRFDSEGQRRMCELHGGRRENLEVSPDLWAGVGLVRGGAGTALVGDADTVAERLLEYHALGIDTFILSGYPHLEEAYRAAELLFPKLPLSVAITEPERTGPVGELMANDILPTRAER